MRPRTNTNAIVTSRLRRVLVVGLLGVFPSVALAGVVKGKVSGAEKLLNPVWNESKEATANRYTWREPSATVRAEFRTLYGYAPKEVCIAALSNTPMSPSSAPLAIKIGGGRTTPVTLVVPPGTSLEFQNKDPFPHRLYVVGQASFQPSTMRGASSRHWKVPGPGKYELRDEVSPSVRSWIVVEPNVVAVTFPTREGTFAFPQLPTGEYTLQAYFDGAPVGVPYAFKLTTDAAKEIKEPLNLSGAPDAKTTKE